MGKDYYDRIYDFDEPIRPKNPNLYIELATSIEEGFILTEDSNVLTTEDKDFLLFN